MNGQSQPNLPTNYSSKTVGMTPVLTFIQQDSTEIYKVIFKSTNKLRYSTQTEGSYNRFKGSLPAILKPS